MVGVITERDLEAADESFPGIARFFEELAEKPRTFLELVARFEDWGGADADADALTRSSDRSSPSGSARASA